MKLEFPNAIHEKEYKKVLEEFWERSSPGRLFDWEDFQDFLEMINNDISKNSMWVNSHLFFAIVDKQIVGAIQIRHHIEHPWIHSTRKMISGSMNIYVHKRIIESFCLSVACSSYFNTCGIY